ncbi:GDSL-type esterase/lipase family protein [Gordonia sp. NPDC003585]|uniref:GDSL-type esterase/lipase family protein n=1 Tax=Gordonia sp. NPDC003585 TaxID=3154275 RepID=UPI0033A8F916
MRRSSSVRTRWRAGVVAVAAGVVVVASGLGPARVSTIASAVPTCAGTHFVASWAMSPTDSVTPVDASAGPVPMVVSNQTFRMIVTPHLGGEVLRVRLTNRFGSSPITFGRTTVATQLRGARVSTPVAVHFGGKNSVTVPAGADVVSDPVVFRVRAFVPLAVSIHVPGTMGPPTKHWNANATSFYTGAGAGDATGRTSAAGYTSTTKSWFYVNALDVRAPASTRSIVAFGNSITDGFVGATPLSVPADPNAADRQGRYPDGLQRRLIGASIPISVVNAGIGSNRLLTSGEPLLLGSRGLSRFRRDALEQSGVAGVLLLEGINDVGLPPFANADGMIAGYRDAIGQAHRAGVKIWLGTIKPASNALVDGVLLNPQSEHHRQQINAWIRGQRSADGVVDFDAATRDPANPSVLRREFASPDNLHPSLAGYRAMAHAVDLPMLATASSPRC